MKICRYVITVGFITICLLYRIDEGDDRKINKEEFVNNKESMEKVQILADRPMIKKDKILRIWTTDVIRFNQKDQLWNYLAMIHALR